MRIVRDEPKRQRRNCSPDLELRGGAHPGRHCRRSWKSGMDRCGLQTRQTFRSGTADARREPARARAAKATDQGRRVAAAHSRGGRAFQSRRPWLAVPHGRGLEEGRGAL